MVISFFSNVDLLGAAALLGKRDEKHGADATKRAVQAQRGSLVSKRKRGRRPSRGDEAGLEREQAPGGGLSRRC